MQRFLGLVTYSFPGKKGVRDKTGKELGKVVANGNF